MDCGIPFCHHGCPLGNRIPEWNDHAYRGRWRQAIEELHATNNFPEFTGYTCPAPCEAACVLEINDDPVMIKQIELATIERAFAEGWVVPRPPPQRSGRRVAVVGSGPAGLAVAAQLNYASHSVTVFERDEHVGGLLRFGIPDFKLEKWVIDRRVDVLKAEGVEFRCGVDVGVDVAAEELREHHDAVVLAIGSRQPRPLQIPGADLDGVIGAMPYLYARNRAIARHQGRESVDTSNGQEPSAVARKVVVLGGGDTAADCIANAHREGADEVVQFDRYPEPQGSRPRELAGWPRMPKRLPPTYAQEEGGELRWGETAVRIEGNGHVQRVVAAEMDGPPDWRPVPGSQRTVDADLVIAAIGFLHPQRPGIVEMVRAGRTDGGLVETDGYATAADGVFACGDANLGASLVVSAIDDGRRCAEVVDQWLATGEVATARDAEAADPRRRARAVRGPQSPR